MFSLEGSLKTSFFAEGLPFPTKLENEIKTRLNGMHIKNPKSASHLRNLSNTILKKSLALH